jgi:tetratricopeptide (TPR) repeat protein
VIPVLLAIWLAWQTASPEASQHMQAGAEADKQGRFEVAIAEFKRATELAPDQPDGFVSLGQAYMENQDYGAAVPPLKHALELAPELAAAHQLLGYALLAQGYNSEAISHLEKIEDPTALGIAQIGTGQLAQAVANLQAALAKHPNDPDLLYYLGRAAGLLAKQSIDTLVATYPDAARAHQAMAENYFVLRQMPQAEKEFREALRLRPSTPELHLELGLVYAGSFQWAKAEEEFRAQAKLQPGNAEAFYRLGSALLQQGKAREARTELERSNRLQPDMPETLYSLGKAAALGDDGATAEKVWSQLLTLEKDTPLAGQTHFALAGLYRKQGKTGPAEREMQEFQKSQKAGAAPESVQK